MWLLIGMPTHAEDVPEDVTAVAKAFQFHPDSGGLLMSCPADYAGTWTKTVGQLRMCENDWEGCLARCLDRDGASCWDLGYLLQEYEEQIGSVPAQIAFARACKESIPSGCTNRAASIMNQPLDPYRISIDEEAQYQCTFKTFERSCRDGDAWGCTMVAIHYQEGFHVDPDPDQKQRYLEQACELAPDSEACFLQ